MRNEGRCTRISNADLADRQDAEAAAFQINRDSLPGLKRLLRLLFSHSRFDQEVARAPPDAFLDERGVGQSDPNNPAFTRKTSAFAARAAMFAPALPSSTIWAIRAETSEG